MKGVFLHYFCFTVVTYIFGNITIPLWGFISAGDGTRYTLKTLDAVTEDIERVDDRSYLIHANITIANRKAPDVLKIAPRAILKFAKLAINKSLDTALSVGLASEVDFFAMCFGTEDQKEGSTAFLEKRKPVYIGR